MGVLDFAISVMLAEESRLQFYSGDRKNPNAAFPGGAAIWADAACAGNREYLIQAVLLVLEVR